MRELELYKILCKCYEKNFQLQKEIINELIDEIKKTKKTCGSHWPSNHNWCGCEECGQCECVRCQEFEQTPLSNSIPEYGSQSSLNFDEWQKRCKEQNVSQFKLVDPFCKVCNCFLDELNQCKECLLSKVLD